MKSRSNKTDSSSLLPGSTSSSKSSKSRKRRATELESEKKNGEKPNTICYHLPRIWKSDIRRQYATMFANVYNTCDYDYMKKYIETFYRPDMTLVLTKGLPEINAPVLDKQECSGFDNCGAVWFERMNDAPDLAFNLQQTQMKLRTDGTAVVSASFEITGTKILQLTPEDMIKYNIIPSPEITASTFSSSSSLSPSSSSSTPYYSNSDMVDDIFSDPEISQALEDILNDNGESNGNPKPIVHVGQEAILFDEVNDNLVCKFEEAMKFNRQNNCPPPSNAVTVPFKFIAKGRFSLHLDSDSKVYLVDFKILLDNNDC